MRKPHILGRQNLTSSHWQLVVIMRIYVCIYGLLSGVWSIVETTDLHITGYVGSDVSFACSWDKWTWFTGGYTLYLCANPCHKATDIIVMAESGKTAENNRIRIRNSGKRLEVSITKLKKSDKTFVCGLERTLVTDEFIKVHLDVKDAPVTTVKMTTATTLEHPDISTGLSNVSTTTMLHESNYSSSGPGWLAGLAVVLAVTVVALLMFYIKRTRKSQVVFFSARNPTEDDGETRTNEEMTGEDQSTENPTPVYATVNKTNKAHPTSIYANVGDYTHQDPTDLT